MAEPTEISVAAPKDRLASFLDEKRVEGHFDSVGNFTVSFEKARRKVQEYSLPDNDSWVTLIVQAAAGWDLQTLRVRQTRHWTTFDFTPSERTNFPEEESLLRVLTEGELTGEHPVQRLCLALHFLRTREKLSFHLRLNAESGRTEYQQGTHQLATSARPGAVGIQLSVSHLDDSQRSLLALWDDSNGGAARRRLAVAAKLLNSASFLAFPVSLDNRPIQVRETPIFFEELAGTHEVKIGVPEGLQNLHPSRTCTGLIYVLYGKTKRQSTLVWLKTGVSIEQASLHSPHAYSLHILVPAVGLKTDLTGLQLVRDEMRGIRLESVREEVQNALESWLEAQSIVSDELRQLIEAWLRSLAEA